MSKSPFAFGRIHWPRHAQIFLTVFVGGGLLTAAYAVFANGQAVNQALCALRRWALVYAALHSLVILLESLLRGTSSLVLRAYYGIWVGVVFRYLRRASATAGRQRWPARVAQRMMRQLYDCDTASLILDSMDDNDGKPTVIRRRDLDADGYLEDKAFSVVVLTNRPLIHARTNPTRHVLEVDLRNQSAAIYNSAGKNFLRSRYLQSQHQKDAKLQGTRIDTFLRSDRAGESIALVPPFRWASGGAIGIASLDGSEWVTVFFRGVHPIGWNVANGASERSDEYKSLHRLMLREFAEELIVLDRYPMADDPRPLTHKAFRPADPLLEELPDDIRRELTSRRFTDRHTHLRRAHDQLNLSSREELTIDPIPTPHAVRIDYHERDGRTSAPPSERTNLVFSVNPGELGIETIRFYRYTLTSTDYLMFGEIHERADFLVREPVGLLRLDWLRSLFDAHDGSLGVEVWDEEYAGGKRLPRIPSSAYRLFTADNELRERRLEHLRKLGRTATKTDEIELQFHDTWLTRYQSAFTSHEGGHGDVNPDDVPYLCTLCPVTWRSLEALFRTGYGRSE